MKKSKFTEAQILFVLLFPIEINYCSYCTDKLTIKGWKALVLNIFAPGLGYVYRGNVKKQ